MQWPILLGISSFPLYSLRCSWSEAATTMSSGISRIRELASRILSNVDQVDTYLETNNLPQPSFGAQGPAELCIKSKSVEACRIATIEDAIEMQDLLLGPKMLLRPIVCGRSVATRPFRADHRVITIV